MSNETDQKDQKFDLLCGECGETFSDFLQEMADKNAKVATCPKCGKIHNFDPSKADELVKGGGGAAKK